MNMQEGDSKRDRPRRLTELKGTEWHPEPQDGDWGQPSPNSQQAGRVGGKKGGVGLPQSHIKFRVFTQGLLPLWVSKPYEQFAFPMKMGVRISLQVCGE